MPQMAANKPGGRWRVNFNTVLALGCIGLSIFLFAAIPYQIERPPVLFGQSASGLDPAFFPTLVAVLLLIVGAIYFWVSLGLDEPNGFRALTAESYRTVAVTLAVFVFYAAILRPTGFLLSSGLVVVILSVFYGARHIPSIALVAVGVPLLIYAIFRRLLLVALPELPDF